MSNEEFGPLSWPKQPRVKLGDLGAQVPLDPTFQAFRDNIHAFARDVMRPIGIQLDKMTPEEVIAKDSPYWEVRRKFETLGINPVTMSELGPEGVAIAAPILYEEMGWGDSGLAVTLGSGQLINLLPLMFNKPHLLERFPVGKIGVWCITEPDHGTDMLDPNFSLQHPSGNYGRPNCIAKIEKDKIILNGQKSAWPSNAPVAEVCLLFCSADIGNGPDPQNGVCLLVDLSSKGVSKGKPLNKLGQRALPQGEIFFDNVEVPLDQIIAGPEDYQRAVYAVHAEANVAMCGLFTGVARAAYEIAYDYAHTRKQGGVPIIKHKNVAAKLFHMYRRVETARALCQRVALYNLTQPIPSLQSAMICKVTGTEAAFDNANDAMQMMGGNGISKEFPIEKIFRDARLALIEDGNNEVLAMKGGFQMMDLDRV